MMIKMVNERKASQMFSIRNVNPTGTINPDIEFTQPYSKYVPFNFIQVKNITDKDLSLFLNGNFYSEVPAGTIFTADLNNVPSIRNIQYTITASTGTVEINFQKVRTVSGSINQAYERSSF